MKEALKALNPGYEVFFITCYTQLLLGIIMPWTLCGCLWGCCGLATPCTRCLYHKVKSREIVKQTVMQMNPLPQQSMEKK